MFDKFNAFGTNFLGVAWPTVWALVRILVVIAFLFTSGLLAVAYLACWIGIPEAPLSLPGDYSSSFDPARKY